MGGSDTIAMTAARYLKRQDTAPRPAAGPLNWPSGSGTVRSIDSNELMAGQRMIVIVHGKDEYRLQVTGTGKLILTK